MKRFQVYRRANLSATHNKNQVNEPNEVQFEGVVFTDGSCAIRWRTLKSATSMWNSFEDMSAIHIAGHPGYDTVVQWLDDDEEQVEEPDPLFYATCGVCGTTFQNDKPIDNVFCSVCREHGYTLLGVLNSGPTPGRHNLNRPEALSDDAGIIHD